MTSTYSKTGKTHVIDVIGTRHGVGATTNALMLAIAGAHRGFAVRLHTNDHSIDFTAQAVGSKISTGVASIRQISPIESFHADGFGGSIEFETTAPTRDTDDHGVDIVVVDHSADLYDLTLLRALQFDATHTRVICCDAGDLSSLRRIETAPDFDEMIVRTPWAEDGFIDIVTLTDIDDDLPLFEATCEEYDLLLSEELAQSWRKKSDAELAFALRLWDAPVHSVQESDIIRASSSLGLLEQSQVTYKSDLFKAALDIIDGTGA